MTHLVFDQNDGHYRVNELTLPKESQVKLKQLQEIRPEWMSHLDIIAGCFCNQKLGWMELLKCIDYVVEVAQRGETQKV